DSVSRFSYKGDVPQYRLIVSVGKRHVTVLDMPSGTDWLFLAQVALHRFVDDFENAVSGRPGALKHLVQSMEPADRLIEKSNQDKKCHELSNSHAPIEYGCAS